MNSKPFRLDVSDFLKGAVVAVIVAILGAVQQALSAHGLDVGAWDWGFILNLGVSTFIGYLGKNFISDEEGKVLTPFGRVG